MNDPRIRAWNRRVDPKDNPYFYKRPFPPVTNEDLGGENAVHFACLRKFDCEIISMEEVPANEVRFDLFTEALFQVGEGRAKLRAVNVSETLDKYTQEFDFGDGIAPWANFLYAENYREVIDEIARRGLWLINIGGHIPFKTPPVPKEAVAYARKALGGKFFGVDNGEHDCRFVLGACDDAELYKKPVSLKEGWANFLDYEYRIHEYIARYPITLSNNTFQHYLADIRYTRMLGCQICESKPNIQLWHAILRGACEQYGLRFWTAPAEWNLWGAKDYMGEGSWGSPELGTSISLLSRAWLLTYMYGASAIMGQYAYFMPDGSLSPVGKQIMDSERFIKEHPERGVPHAPVALIWGFDSGYVTAKHAPRRERPYMAWGNIPYTRGLYQIDAVNDAFYPNMTESAYWRDETGYLSDTPCGDVFEVLLSNTSLYALSKYTAAIVLGASVEGAFFERLEAFIERGGSVAVSSYDLTDESRAYFGISDIEGEATALTGEAEGVRFNEAPFKYQKAKLTERAKVLATAYDASPLAYELDTGFGGSVLVFLSDHMLSEQVCDIPSVCPTDSPLPRPFLLLRHAENLLTRFARRWNFVEPRGSHDIGWFANVGEREDEAIVTLYNNRTSAWEGEIRLRGANIASGENWTTGEAIMPGAICGIKLPPHGAAVVRVRADRDIIKIDRAPRIAGEDVRFESDAIFDPIDRGDAACAALKFGYCKNK